MFQQAIRLQSLPKYLSTDNDPLYRFHQWQANLRVLEVIEMKAVTFVPLSHPFVERLIGTIRRECLDRTLFWTIADLEEKLFNDFRNYFNGHRVLRIGRAVARTCRRTRINRKFRFVPLAEALSRLVPNPDCCLIS